MTREEALQEIVERVRSTESVDSVYVDCVDIEAMRIAIEALKTKIVRCRDCKHWLNGFCVGLPINGDDATSLEMDADDFCSYGEREEKE